MSCIEKGHCGGEAYMECQGKTHLWLFPLHRAFASEPTVTEAAKDGDELLYLFGESNIKVKRRGGLVHHLLFACVDAVTHICAILSRVDCLS